MGVHKSLIVSASNLCTPFSRFIRGILCTALILCCLATWLPDSLLQGCAMSRVTERLNDIRNLRHHVRKLHNFCVVVAGHNFPITLGCGGFYQFSIVAKNHVGAAVAKL
jgi:hypothetical protein